MKLTAVSKEARCWHSLTAIGGTLLSAGGYDGSGWLKSVELLSPGQTAWTTADWSLDDLVLKHCAVALSDYELVILGGLTNRKAFRLGNIFLSSLIIFSFVDRVALYIEIKVCHITFKGSDTHMTSNYASLHAFA